MISVEIPHSCCKILMTRHVLDQMALRHAMKGFYSFTQLLLHFFLTYTDRALWIVTKRPGKKTYSFVSFLSPSPYGMCLERKSTGPFGIPLFPSDKIGMGLCSSAGITLTHTYLNFFTNTSNLCRC